MTPEEKQSERHERYVNIQNNIMESYRRIAAALEKQKSSDVNINVIISEMRWIGLAIVICGAMIASAIMLVRH